MAAAAQAHAASKMGILLGNGLPDLRRTSEIVAALKAVGFEACTTRHLPRAPARG